MAMRADLQETGLISRVSLPTPTPNPKVLRDFPNTVNMTNQEILVST